MSFNEKYISYKQTGAFSKIVLDYLDSATELKPFYDHQPDLQGFKNAIESRKTYPTNRKLLVHELQKQYQSVVTTGLVKANIESLSDSNTFTVCNAHQPNIFTGHLYFIYKILHCIKLAEELKTELPANHFVPVYYMGSEDADLDELGEVNINGKKYKWETGQKGAVGRMKIDKAFIKLIDEIESQLLVEKFGYEIVSLVKDTYTISKTIEQATFEFVNLLFADYGLLVLLPDNAVFKKELIPVLSKELYEQFSNKQVTETIAEISETYKVQVAGRTINLFYLKDDIRERIELKDNGYSVVNTSLFFTKEEMNNELMNHPERFSPNVILRPVYQEIILPNIAFIGGGGELAYWLELKRVFNAVTVPFPVLLLRNSFMVVPSGISNRMVSLEMPAEVFFNPESELIASLVTKESAHTLHLEAEKKNLVQLYEKMKANAGAVDTTLMQHVEALAVQAVNRIEKLEKKIYKAEKKKFEAKHRQVSKIKETLFPSGTLQERVDNLLPYYAKWGKSFIPMLYNYSKGMDQQFCILDEQ